MDVHSNRKFTTVSGILALSLFWTAAPVALGDDERQKGVEQPAASDLASLKQAEAREKLKKLEETMDRLSRLLSATEPDKAVKLRSAFQQSRERLVREGMEQVVEFIRDRKLYDAIENQKVIVSDLEELLSILLEKDIDPRELLKEIRRLRDIVEDLDQVIREETSEKLASDDATAAKAAAAELKQHLERLDELVKEEKAIESALGDAKDGAGKDGVGKPGGGSDAEKKKDLDQLSKRQDDTREKTEELQRDVAAAAAKSGGESSAGAASKPGSPGSQGSPGQSQSVDAQKLSQARKAMQEASKAMQRGDHDTASRRARAARQALEEARQGGQEKLERLRRMQDFARMKKEQDATRGKTDKIARRMRKTPPLTFSPEGGVPGRKDVESASGSMESASENLSQGDAGEASPRQEEALSKLQKGREKAERTLADLQKALRERILAYLRERITFMLDKQRKISRDTKSLDARLRALAVAADSAADPVDPSANPSTSANDVAPAKDAPTEPSEAGATNSELADARAVDRRDLQRAERLSRQEGALVVVAEDIVDLLEEDGTTLVFPRIVGQVKDDLENVQGLLARVKTGKMTQRIQKDIETSLKEILEAIKQAQKKPPPPNPNKGRKSKSGSGPLLPPSSELKMVLSMQLRVNKRTRLFDLDRAPDQLTLEEERQAKRISDSQGEIKKLLRKIALALGEGR